MLKTRVILFALASALGYGEYWIHGSDLDLKSQVALHIVGAILWLAATNILVFSFVRIGEMPDGRLCFNPNNPYWRFMKWAYGKWWGDRVSLCKSYWLTVSIIATTLLCIGGVSFGGYKIFKGIYAAVRDPNLESRHESLMALGMSVAIVLFGWGVGYICSKLTEKFLILMYLWYSIFGAFVLAAFVALPIYYIHVTQRVPVSAAIRIYSPWAMVIAMAISVAVLLVWAAFRYIPALRKTWLGQLLKAAKDKACPIFVACPYDTEPVH